MASDRHPLAETFDKANLRLAELLSSNVKRGNCGRENAALGRFDLTIGGDVLYERSHPLRLASFIQPHANSLLPKVLPRLG